MVVATASALTVMALGVGLASAQGETPSIPGVNAKAHAHDKGNVADAHTIAELRARERNATSTTTRGTTHTPTTRHPVTPTTVNALQHEVLAVGDSVMLGAEQSLEAAIPTIYVDAKVSRQFWDATVVLQQYKNAGLLPPTIVVHMGTNGDFSDADFAQMMASNT